MYILRFSPSFLFNPFSRCFASLKLRNEGENTRLAAEQRNESVIGSWSRDTRYSYTLHKSTLDDSSSVSSKRLEAFSFHSTVSTNVQIIIEYRIDPSRAFRYDWRDKQYIVLLREFFKTASRQRSTTIVLFPLVSLRDARKERGKVQRFYFRRSTPHEQITLSSGRLVDR